MKTLKAISIGDGLTLCAGKKGSVVKKNGVVVQEIPGLGWSGNFDVIVVKNGKEEHIAAKNVHWDETYNERFKFIEPEGGGIIIVDTKTNTVVTELNDYEYAWHREHYLAARKDGKMGVISCYRLQKKLSEGRQDNFEIKIPFNYHYIRIGRHTFGLQSNKRGHMVYMSKNGKILSPTRMGCLHSIADGREQAIDLGHMQIVVPSPNFPGLYALFLPHKPAGQDIVLDGAEKFEDQEHYITAVYPDKPDGSSGEVKHFTSELAQIP